MSLITESNKQILDERVRVLVDTYDEVRMLCGEGSYDGLTLSTIVEGIFKLKLLTDLCESTVAELGIYEPEDFVGHRNRISALYSYLIHSYQQEQVRDFWKIKTLYVERFLLI